MPEERWPAWKACIGGCMKVTIETLEKKKASIIVKDAKLYIMNSLRRIMLSDLPKLAIQDVIIYDNTSALFDEIISHRLCLIPLPTDLELLNFREDCTCSGKGCPSCTVRYTLSKEGAGMVTSSDLVPAEESWKVSEGKIPIVELFNDQRLILEVEAVLGRGRDHAKWQPVQAPGYRFIPTISFDPKDTDKVKEFIEEIPQDIVTLKKDSLELRKLEDIAVLESYIDTLDISFITIEKDASHLQFHFETDGSLTAEDTLQHTIQIFEEKLDTFSELLQTL